MTQEETSNLKDIHQYAIATGDRFNFEKGAGAFRGVQTVVNLGILASPLEPGSIKPTAPDSPLVLSDIAACTSVYNRDELTRISAEVTGSYGGASGSVAATYVKNISISETSSSFVAFFRKSFGRVHLNSDAKLAPEAIHLLQTNAQHFIQRYGKMYVSAYRLSSQFFGEVKIDASSMADKIKVDGAVSASYKSILKANSTFESDLQKSQSKYNMSVSAKAMGTHVPVTGVSSVKDMAEVVKKIEAEADINAATITEVTLSSWLHLADFAKHVKNEDVRLFDPRVTPAQLNLFSANYESILWMASFTEDSIRNLDSKLVRQWYVSDKPQREDKLKEAGKFANDKIDQLSRVTEAEVASVDFIKSLSEAIRYFQNDKIIPALKLHPFTFKIEAKVSTSYSDYRVVEMHNRNIRVFPYEKFSVIEDVVDVDNHHSNCRHFYGHQHSKYTDGAQGKEGTAIRPSLSFNTWWNRVCGSAGWSNTETFNSGLNGKCQLNYNDTVRVDIKWDVVFAQLRELPSGNEDDVMELAYAY
jgi:hypothetical protein